MIRIIAAIDDKMGLARENKIPWKLPTDVEYYKNKTMHSNVLMGYRTYELYSSPLSDKKNYVAVRPGTELRPEYLPVENARQFLRNSKEDVWVIGGGGLFAATLSEADELYLTRVKGDFHCNVFFPPFEDSFEIALQREEMTENNTSFHFEIWRRKPQI